MSTGVKCSYSCSVQLPQESLACATRGRSVARPTCSSLTRTLSPTFFYHGQRYPCNSVSAYWWRNQQVSVSQGSAQEFAKKLVDQGADAVFKASDLDGDGTLNQEEFSLAIADQQMGFAKFEVRIYVFYFVLLCWLGMFGTRVQVFLEDVTSRVLCCASVGLVRHHAFTGEERELCVRDFFGVAVARCRQAAQFRPVFLKGAVPYIGGSPDAGAQQTTGTV